jgi:hypothetical protein
MKTLTNLQRLNAAIDEAGNSGFSSEHQDALIAAGRKLGACLKEIEAVFDSLRDEPIMEYRTTYSRGEMLVSSTVSAEFDAMCALHHIGDDMFLIGWDAGHIVNYAAAVEIEGTK